MFNLADQLAYVFMFLLGAILGSFANVVIYRMPRGESVVKPRSHCYQCKKMVAWYDNIPVVSWFVLKGRCRNCKAKFSIRYPLVEFITGIIFVLSFEYAGGFNWTLLEYLLFVFPLVICTFIDLDHMILPDEFTLSGIVIGLVGAGLNPQRDFMDALFGVLMGGGFLWGIAIIYYLVTKTEGMGGGDIKLLAWIGAIVGWKGIPFIIMTSAIIGSVAGLLASRKGDAGLKTVIPFGPFLALAALIYLFGGETIALWYSQLFLPELV